MLLRVQKNKENPYVMLNKSFLIDSNLSAKSKGILAYIFTLPDDWKIYLDELAKHFKDGVKSVTSGINELITNGYIERTPLRDEKGKFKGYMYDVYEVLPETPKAENGKTENGKRQTTNKVLKLNNNITDNDIKSVSQSVKPEQTDRPTDETLKRLIKVAEVYSYPDATAMFIEGVIGTLWHDGGMKTKLKLGLNHSQIRDRLRLCRLNHIDTAMAKMRDCRTNKELYFMKCLLTTIVEPDLLEHEDCFDAL
jgi:hypothetical protein